MSREEDEARLYRSFEKYEEIVKQVLLLDELTESMDPSNVKLPILLVAIRTVGLQNPRGDNCGGTESGSVLDRESFDQAIVQTITKFLHDLNTSTIDPSPRTSNQ
ncbi:unnamed protein product [Dovyalis caffra]|uniref:Uncharacterized protein n=1 Tax=Dovyalis caffra TaxID=77055 RepID=A0AAV1RF15_9ROSI|nr:unnamed protein product [Dovyalis caffra]